MVLPRYEIYEGTDNKFRFRLLSGPAGHVTLYSVGGYVKLRECQKAVEICQANAQTPDCFSIRHTGTVSYIALKEDNYNELARTNSYSSMSELHVTLRQVKKDAATKNVILKKGLAS